MSLVCSGAFVFSVCCCLGFFWGGSLVLGSLWLSCVFVWALLYWKHLHCISLSWTVVLRLGPNTLDNDCFITDRIHDPVSHWWCHRPYLVYLFKRVMSSSLANSTTTFVYMNMPFAQVMSMSAFICSLGSILYSVSCPASLSLNVYHTFISALLSLLLSPLHLVL